MVEVVDGLISEWKTPQVIDKIDSKHRDAALGTWVSNRGIVIPCIYVLYGAKVHKSNVRVNIKHIQRNIMFEKTQVKISLSQTPINKAFS